MFTSHISQSTTKRIKLHDEQILIFKHSVFLNEDIQGEEREERVEVEEGAEDNVAEDFKIVIDDRSWAPVLQHSGQLQ